MEKTHRWSDRRIVLKDVLPIETPISISIEPAKACNFKCSYCYYSPDNQAERLPATVMSVDTFDNFVKGLKNFKSTLKNIRFAGVGEPFVNKNLPYMISQIRPFVQEISVFTNGALLTPELSHALIDAGLDTLRISLQGHTSEEYKSLSMADIDYYTLYKNIAYFNSVKNNCKVYVKILDISLNETYTAEDFKAEYSPVCDYTLVEYLVPGFIGVDYDKFGKTFTHSQVGFSAAKSRLCAMPFYQMTLNADGSVSVCCSDSYQSITVGNVNDKSISDIWSSPEMNRFRLSLLEGNYHESCIRCKASNYAFSPQDTIDEIADKLIEAYK